ncbi:MAG TPA: alpha-ketoglutarate decarboxylase [Flavobacteriaceae bacterium]|nr:alpha-ketoglutarate decarboxylase [Flavobacteriaceae bacterium]
MKNTNFKLLDFKLLLIFFAFFTTLSFSQENLTKNENNFWKHVRFGGGFGLSTGDGFFSVTLAPNAIYQFNRKYGLGVGLNGTYNRQKNVYKSTIFGGSVIGLLNPIPEIQLSTEFEALNVNRKFEGAFSNNQDNNYWYPALFIGAGYRTNNITFGIRFDVLYDDNKSIYANSWMPFVRVLF